MLSLMGMFKKKGKRESASLSESVTSQTNTNSKIVNTHSTDESLPTSPIPRMKTLNIKEADKEKKLDSPKQKSTRNSVSETVINNYIGETNASGQRHGVGVQTFTNGVYSGSWENDKMCGIGTFTFHSGSKYEGSFRGDMFNGKGTYTWNDGKIYCGNYVDGKREGFGRQKYKNANVYEGAWKNDKKHGKGELIYSTGENYQGEWKMNKKDGTGVFTNKNGETIEQFWNDGKLFKEYVKPQAADANGVQTAGESDNLEKVAKELRDELIKPLKEKNNKQEDQIIELSEKLANQKEEYTKQLNKSQKKVDKLSQQMKERAQAIVSLKEQVNQLHKQVEEEQSKTLCVICFERTRDTILLPCMHYLFCNQCTTQSITNNRCPNCRATIQGKLQCILH